MKQRLIEIIEELREAVQELETKKFWVSNDTIFDKAVSIYLKEVVNKSKLPNEVKRNFKPTEMQIEGWKNTKPSPKTLGLLKAKGLSQEDLKEVKTQYDAHIILNSLKKENI